MPNTYENIFFSVSTPYGLVEVGWRFEKKNRCSNVLCLICKEFHCEETVKKFVMHLMRTHPEIGYFLSLRNFDRMIV